jgi:hypothetical protein
MMGQTSGPITGENFTDQMWRDLFGAEPAIVGDVNGTAYQMVLPPSTNDVQIGSPSQDSLAVVAGKAHKIPAGETVPLTIPASTHAATGRTDLVVLRFDPTLSGDAPLGPVRLHRVAGVEGSSALPSYDGGPPGVEDLPLYAVTRKQGQSLNQAAVKDLRVRSGPNLLYVAGATASGNTPIGSRMTRDGVVWRRDLSGGQPEWVRETPLPPSVVSSFGNANNSRGWTVASTAEDSRLVRDGDERDLYLELRRAGGPAVTSSSTGHVPNVDIFQLTTAGDRPPREVPVVFKYVDDAGADFPGLATILKNGWIELNSLMPSSEIRVAGINSWSIRLHAHWSVA